uniref:Anoctamin transmembrane domain-containing protein n=1 Tax=Globisporangium ultimum (strain ATCC 200006 / CBS 805.95 / DAOM BR144) TaxID=431595 RepID=K3WWJ3_GLOUD
MDLYEACENGNEERVVELLVFGDEWLGVRRSATQHKRYSASGGNAASERYDSLIEDALVATAVALANAAATSAGLMLSPKTMLRARGTAGRTPLHAACMGGQVGIVRLLLGEPCPVYFTSRTQDEVMELLAPLVKGYEEKKIHDDDDTARVGLYQVRMATKDDGADLVPVATVRFDCDRSISPQDLLEGRKHVDDFGNTPLQCISCFGCGSSNHHVDDGLEITKHLLIHGDQPNLPKLADKWTPLHWSAYNGNWEQIAILLNPPLYLGKQNQKIGKTQFSIPLFVNGDNLFAMDIAGRRGLMLLSELKELREQQAQGRSMSDYAKWRLRLSHVDALKIFTQEFLENAAQLARYVNEMNDRLPILLLRDKKAKKKRFTCADAIRYGQHLLYWAGCFGLVSEACALLELRMEIAASSAELHASYGSLHPATINGPKGGKHGATQEVYLQPLYVCSCEENKRQSVLHAVASHGQQEILTLLLSKMLYDQQHPPTTVVPLAPSGLRMQKTAQPRKMNLVVPTSDTMRKMSVESPTMIAMSGGLESAAVEKATEKLGVLALIDTGWRNYRNETPLYLAVLHLQHSVVSIFSHFLTHESLVWELANCNVEGSYIHHVVHDHSRHLLGISAPRKMVCAEYVMLFDGIKKKQFKETLVEAMREESPITPPLVVTRTGKRLTPAAWYYLRFTPKQTDYVVIGTTDEVTVRHAEALQLKIKHRGSSIRSKYNASTPELFEPFRSLQRQQVVMDIIQKNVNLKKHLRKGNLKAIFPLHDASGCKNIVRNWVYTDDRQRIFQPFTGTSVSQFLFEDRTHPYEMLWPLLTYFGEKHAFYYSFVIFYSVWLVLIALPGAICQLLSYVVGAYYLSPLFAVFVSIWATLVVERWKRKKSEIQMSFGNFKRNRNEEAHGFYGDFQVETIEKSIVDMKFPKSLQLMRIYCGIPVLLTMASFVVIIFISVKVTTVSSEVQYHAPSWMPDVLLPYVIPLLNAISMLILDNLYTAVALALTQWENHRTVWQYESMLAVKLFWFKFLNAFISLLWVAFVDRDTHALRKQLIIVMGMRQIWYMFIRNIWPLFLVQQRWKSAGFRLKKPSPCPSASGSSSSWRRCLTFTREWYNAELPHDSTATAAGSAANSVPSLVLVQEMMLPPDFLMGKQMEIVLQFGYITMFVSVLPIGPLLALVSNVINTRLDVICCTQVKRRPPFESETEVSTFMSILEFMSFAAVAVNCSVLFFTTKDDLESLLELASTHWKDDAAFYLKKLWLLLAIEHIVLGAKALLSLTIDDSATWVQNDEDRNDDEEKKIGQRDHQSVVTEADDFTSLVSDADRSYSAKQLLESEYEHLIDELLAEASDWKQHKRKISMSTSSALNGALAEKVSAAMKERDAAIAREVATEQKLRDSTNSL